MLMKGVNENYCDVKWYPCPVQTAVVPVKLAYIIACLIEVIFTLAIFW